MDFDLAGVALVDCEAVVDLAGVAVVQFDFEGVALADGVDSLDLRATFAFTASLSVEASLAFLLFVAETSDDFLRFFADGSCSFFLDDSK